jgi:hypothetical protein
MVNVFVNCLLAVVLLLIAAGAAGQSTDSDSAAPRLIEDSDGARWDDCSSFGPVPPSLQEKGNALCRAAGFDRAAGYDPNACDAQGRRFSGGGFFCVGKAD